MLKKIIKFFLIVFVLILILIVIIASLIYITNTKLLSIELKEAWIGFVGAIVGGIITFLGVLITIYYGEKTRQKTYDDNLALTNEQLRLEKKPYLEIEVSEDIGNNNVGSLMIIPIEKPSNDKIPVKIKVNNLWENVAKNVSVQIIIEDTENQGKHKITEFLAPKSNYQFTFSFSYNQSSLRIKDKIYQKNFKLIFFYEDILSNCYKQEYHGGIVGNYNQINNDTSYSFSCYKVEEAKLTKMNYYYISDKEKQKNKKQKEHLKRINESIKKAESFSSMKDVEKIQRYFYKEYFDKKMKYVFDILQKKCKKVYGGGSTLIDFEIMSYDTVLTRIGGGISGENVSLSYNYELEIHLNKKYVKFKKFLITDYEGLSFIDRIKVYIIFHRNKIFF